MKRVEERGGERKREDQSGSKCSRVPVQDYSPRVRRACTETISEVSQVLAPDERVGAIFKVFKKKKSNFNFFLFVNE